MRWPRSRTDNDMQLPGPRMPRAIAAAVALLSLAGAASAQTAAPQRQRRVVSLKEALQLAAEKGPDVAAARAQAAVVAVGVERAYTAWKPDLVATGTFDHTSAPQEIPAIPGLFPKPVTILAANSRFGTLQLSQPLFTPQGLFLPGVAKSAADAASKAADEAREQVLLGVARAYLGLQGVEGLLEAARDAERVALRREEDAKARIAAGTDVEIGLLRAQTETAQARAQIAGLQGQKDATLPVLEAFVGEPVEPGPARVEDFGPIAEAKASPG